MSHMKRDARLQAGLHAALVAVRGRPRVYVFSPLRSAQPDLFIPFRRRCQPVGIMLVESPTPLRSPAGGTPKPLKKSASTNFDRLPLKMRFHRRSSSSAQFRCSRIGAIIGFCPRSCGWCRRRLHHGAAPSPVARAHQCRACTSPFQIIFTSAYTTLVHASTNFTVDIVLAMLLMIGVLAGAQYKSRPVRNRAANSSGAAGAVGVGVARRRRPHPPQQSLFAFDTGMG